jgi:hypothetical protein
MPLATTPHRERVLRWFNRTVVGGVPSTIPVHNQTTTTTTRLRPYCRLRRASSSLAVVNCLLAFVALGGNRHAADAARDRDPGRSREPSSIRSFRTTEHADVRQVIFCKRTVEFGVDAMILNYGHEDGRFPFSDHFFASIFRPDFRFSCEVKFWVDLKACN